MKYAGAGVRSGRDAGFGLVRIGTLGSGADAASEGMLGASTDAASDEASAAWVAAAFDLATVTWTSREASAGSIDRSRTQLGSTNTRMV
jgi:hypothetical protein